MSQLIHVNFQQGCLQLWAQVDYRWDDMSCEALKSYVCKKHEQGIIITLIELIFITSRLSNGNILIYW